jgi:hypothetical protein
MPRLPVKRRCEPFAPHHERLFVFLRTLSLATVAVAAAIELAACGGGGGGGSTAPATPTPGLVVASPNPMILTVSAGANHSATLNLTQANASGVATVNTTCYGGTTAYTTAPTVLNFGVNGGIYTGTYSAFSGLTVGSCTITVTPATGAALVIPVTVGP